MKIFSSVRILLTLSGIIFLLGNNANAAQRIKIATLAPNGSTWFTSLRNMGKRAEGLSNNSLRFKVYGGGIQGTELAVLKKTRSGQLHGGVFTGATLGKIVPDFRIMELPGLFNNYEEVDYVWKKIRKNIENQFFQSGYIFLAYLEVGFINIFTNRNIKDISDFSTMRMWVFQGDPVSKAMADALGISPIPLQIADVRTSLQTGMIDSCYTSPFGSIAMQWYSKTKYLLQPPVTYAGGALVFYKKKWDKLSEKTQKALRKSAFEMEKKTIDKIRLDNENAIENIKDNGAVIVNRLSEKTVSEMKKSSSKVWAELEGKLYSKNTLESVKSYLKDYRLSK